MGKLHTLAVLLGAALLGMTSSQSAVPTPPSAPFPLPILTMKIGGGGGSPDGGRGKLAAGTRPESGTQPLSSFCWRGEDEWEGVGRRRGRGWAWGRCWPPGSRTLSTTPSTASPSSAPFATGPSDPRLTPGPPLCFDACQGAGSSCESPWTVKHSREKGLSPNSGSTSTYPRLRGKTRGVLSKCEDQRAMPLMLAMLIGCRGGGLRSALVHWENPPPIPIRHVQRSAHGAERGSPPRRPLGNIAVCNWPSFGASQLASIPGSSTKSSCPRGSPSPSSASVKCPFVVRFAMTGEWGRGFEPCGTSTRRPRSWRTRPSQSATFRHPSPSLLGTIGAHFESWAG